MKFINKRRKPEHPEKNSWSKDENLNNKLNTHMMQGLGNELEPHWWEASALTIAPYHFPSMAFSYVE